jgi:Family of unknown function (DUF5994)
VTQGVQTAGDNQLRSDSFVDPAPSLPGESRSEGIVDGPPGLMPSSPCRETDFVDYSRLNTMNRAVCGRRLASPVRLTLAIELGEGLDGAWWPHTASVARELPELIGALSARLGEIFDISVNWSSLEGCPDLNAVNRPSMPDPVRVTSHQRLMMITGSQGSANLLVVPCWTSSTLAAMVLRQAATLNIMHAERDTEAFRTANDIVRAARAESALCAQRRRTGRLARIDTADSATTV